MLKPYLPENRSPFNRSCLVLLKKTDRPIDLSQLFCLQVMSLAVEGGLTGLLADQKIVSHQLRLLEDYPEIVTAIASGELLGNAFEPLRLKPSDCPLEVAEILLENACEILT